jgi:hypothetical protein
VFGCEQTAFLEVKVSRVLIPDDDAAKALFYSDRTCCVCRVPKKPLQIHHVDDNNTNNASENLAILCFDCHTETQIKGGFGRKLDAAQVRLYRDEWLDKVGRYTNAQKTASALDMRSTPFTVEADKGDSVQKHRRVESRMKNLEENSRLMGLIFSYDHSGQIDLRDKNIDKILLNKDVSIDTELYLRAKQGKVHLVDPIRVQEQFDEWEKAQNWSSLARGCQHLGRHDEAVKYYCLTCIDALKDGRPFSAGYYMKEMAEKSLVVYLFERALQQAKEKDDVWWQIRSLQELDRDDEIDELVLRNRKLIESSGRGPELHYLRLALKRKRALKTSSKDAPTH